MRASLTALIIAIALGAAADTANAGLKASWPVVIDPTGRTASGSLGTARNDTSDASQYIGCYTLAAGTSTDQGGDGQTTIGCSAHNKNGTALCVLTASAVVNQAGMLTGPMTSDALLWFSWDSSGHCTGIQIWSYASLAPKKLVP